MLFSYSTRIDDYAVAIANKRCPLDSFKFFLPIVAINLHIITMLG